MKSVYRMQANFCRILANPKRLEILSLLRNGEANVTGIARAMEISAASASQELAPLRSEGILRARRNGKEVFYRLGSPKVLHACDLLAEAMREIFVMRVASTRAPYRDAAEPRSRSGFKGAAGGFRE